VLKNVYIFAKNLGAGRHAGQGGFKKPANELCLTGGSGFRENMVCVTARRRLGDFEFCGGGEKPIPANDFAKTHVSAMVSPNFAAKRSIWAPRPAAGSTTKTAAAGL
jgi:hypothetical protein